MNQLERVLYRHFPNDQFPGGEAHGDGEKLAKDLRAVLRNNQNDQRLLLALLVALFIALVIVAFLPRDSVRIGTLGGAGVTASWCLSRYAVLSRRRLAIELLAALASRDSQALRQLVVVCRQLLVQ